MSSNSVYSQSPIWLITRIITDPLSPITVINQFTVQVKMQVSYLFTEVEVNGSRY